LKWGFTVGLSVGVGVGESVEVGVGDGAKVGEEAGVGVLATTVKVGLGVRVGGMPEGLEELQAANGTILTTTSNVMAPKRRKRGLIVSWDVFITSLVNLHAVDWATL
jgi:hypothetical protein